MSTAHITFTSAQIAFLDKWFNQKRTAYTSTVMEDEFPADEESFVSLCDATYNVSGFKVGDMACRETGDKPSVSRKERVKKVKDPNAPKRAKAAYMIWLWSDDGMNKVKVENPELTHKMAMSKAAEVWKGMDEDAKESWVAKSAVQKAEYEAAMKDYVAPGGGEKKVAGKKDDGKVVDDATATQDVPDGVGFAQVNMFMKGLASKKKYGTLLEAVNAMDAMDSAGGVVYDGKSYTIRKSGESIACSQPNILWVKN